MDVGPSRVVVCSANYAWYYRVQQNGSDCDGVGTESDDASAPPAHVQGFPLPSSSSVVEARLSGDEERCFFGTISGHIYVVRPDYRED